MIIQLEILASACTLSLGLLLHCQIDLSKMDFSVVHSFFCHVSVCFCFFVFFNPAFVSCFLPPDDCGTGRDRQPGSEHILQHLLGRVLSSTRNWWSIQRIMSVIRYFISTVPCMHSLYRYGSPSGPNTAPSATAASPSSTTTVPGWGTAWVRHQYHTFTRMSATTETHALPNNTAARHFPPQIESCGFLLCFISSRYHFKKQHVSSLKVLLWIYSGSGTKQRQTEGKKGSWGNKISLIWHRGSSNIWLIVKQNLYDVKTSSVT